MKHDFLNQLDSALETELLSETEPMREHELIQRLQGAPYELFDEQALSGSLQLFQTHFILFNALYRLREKWRQEKLFELSIHTLAIVKKPYEEYEEALVSKDVLADYYLNWEHFESTRANDVDDLLNSFWNRVQGIRQPPAQAELDKAMQVMEFEESEVTDKGNLKRRYRQLLHRHHPDKGGSKQQVQEVKWAYTILQSQVSE